MRSDKEMRVRPFKIAALALATVLSPAAHAQNADGSPPHDTTGAPAVNASAPPPPDQASGVLVRPSSAASALLWVPRVVLFLPRWVLEVPMAPFRLSAYAIDRYQLPERLHQLFFNDAGTFGVYPLFLFETGFGVNVGGRLVHEDLFGHGEQLKLSASFGGEVAQRYAFKLATGRLLGDRLKLEIRTNYQIVPKGNFFGIGN